MIFLVLGILLWSGAHMFKRLFPDYRANLDKKAGRAAKGIIGVFILLSVGLIVFGFRSADYIHVWSPPPFTIHINNLLMLLAIYLFGVASGRKRKVWLGTKIRHPMLTAVKVWATAHLIANGDLASIVLFAGILLWAVAEIVLINHAKPVWKRPKQAGPEMEVRVIGVSFAAFVGIASIHLWFGIYPFGG